MDIIDMTETDTDMTSTTTDKAPNKIGPQYLKFVR